MEARLESYPKRHADFNGRKVEQGRWAKSAATTADNEQMGNEDSDEHKKDPVERGHPALFPVHDNALLKLTTHLPVGGSK